MDEIKKGLICEMKKSIMLLVCSVLILFSGVSTAQAFDDSQHNLVGGVDAAYQVVTPGHSYTLGYKLYGVDLTSACKFKLGENPETTL
ncbi:hypothetical protein Desaci_2009 [Desulfosporosinus acidiphilus SJ4]|uniref:Uncharacterized protein n=2 Tax=Desulfosporosinus TaxID=79206 RepID=I4D5B0_DESAJ|nr:hypothetical protein Desaci_2009 [Desulfosporosinus acidiphilus SJ4]